MINEAGIYLTMLDTDLIEDSEEYPDCLVVKMCLRKDAIGDLKLRAIDFCIDTIPIRDKCDIFIPDKYAGEQIVSFAIPKSDLPYEEIESVSFSVEAEIKTGRIRYFYAA